MVKKKYRQTGVMKSKKLDKKYKALKPGKRIAKKSKKTYYETRKNRSDKDRRKRI